MERIFLISLLHTVGSLCLQWRGCLSQVPRKTEICSSELFHDNNRRLPMFFPPRISAAILVLLLIDAIKVQGKSHNALCVLSGALSLRTGMLFTDVAPHAETLLCKNCRQVLALTLTQYILDATQNKLGLVKVKGQKVHQNKSVPNQILCFSPQIKTV